MEILIGIAILAWKFMWGVSSSNIAVKHRGRNADNWFWWGFWFEGLAWLALFGVKDLRTDEDLESIEI